MDDYDEDFSSNEHLYYKRLTICLKVSKIILILMSLVGNAFVVCRVAKSPQFRKKHLLFLNLSFADVLATLTTTLFALITYWTENEWMAGHALCKALVCVQILTQVGSFYAILAIIIDQFRVVVKPAWPHFSTKAAILGGWLIALLPAVPHLYTASQIEIITDYYICLQTGTFYANLSAIKIYFTLFFTYNYYLPIICGAIMYAVIFLRARPLSSLTVSSNKFKMLMLSLALYAIAVITTVPNCVAISIHSFSAFGYSNPVLAAFMYLVFLSRNSVNPYIYIFFHCKEIFCRRAPEQNSSIPLVETLGDKTESGSTEVIQRTTEADDRIR